MKRGRKRNSKKKKALKDLGWANNWKSEPPAVKRCGKLGHKRKDVDVGPANRGLENVVTCRICNYVYRYDSSD